MIRRPICLLLVAALAGACSADIAGPAASPTDVISCCDPTAPPVELTVYAAASLKSPLEQVAIAYKAQTGDTITVSIDSSSALEAKIEQGAPADVFLSADTTNPDQLVAAGLASGSPVKFAGNQLLIIVPRGDSAAVKSAFDLARSGIKVVAADDDVPITEYATQLVENLAALPDAPAAFEAAYAANVVSKEDNVKAVVAKIELGEGDGAIVYTTDAMASGKVDAVQITPSNANVPATYAGVVVATSAHRDEAAGFLEWLASPDGQAILAQFGFLPPPA